MQNISWQFAESDLTLFLYFRPLWKDKTIGSEYQKWRWRRRCILITAFKGDVYINTGGAFLDAGYVHIGRGSFSESNVPFYTVKHLPNAGQRRKRLEKALPITIEQDVRILAAPLLFDPA